MSSAPPSSAKPARRHRSRQRAEMLEWLRATDSHPTAAQIQEGLSDRRSGVSLATVYRNLELLVAAGQVREVPCERGPTRYDGNVEPHHHFTCEDCGRIADVALPTPRGLVGRLARDHGLRAARVSITFYGRCRACEARRRPPTSAAGET